MFHVCPNPPVAMQAMIVVNKKCLAFTVSFVLKLSFSLFLWDTNQVFLKMLGLDLEKARKKSTGRSHKEAKRRDESRARKSGPPLAERKAAERKASPVDTKTKTTEEDA